MFGIHIINNGYAYPVFLLTVRYLLHGLVFREFSSYLMFFLLSTVAVILRRQFVFLPVVGVASLAYSLIFDYEDYYGKKIFLVLALLSSVLLPDLSERYTTYLQTGRFTSIPFVGFQFVVTPLYVSQADDGAVLGSQDLSDLFTTIRTPLAEEALTEDAFDGEEEIPLMLRYRNFFENYETIAYEKLKPMIESISSDDPLLIDQGLITLSLFLIFANFGKYSLVYLHNITYHMGGYFMASLMLLIFITSFVYHIQHRGRFSLVALVITFMAFSNYLLVALLEPVTQEYSFYTDSLTQALLFALISFLFKIQKGKNRVDSYKNKERTWKKSP